MFLFLVCFAGKPSKPDQNPGQGEIWFKNGSVEPARPWCLAVWWPSVWGSDLLVYLVVLVSGCQDVTSYTKVTMLICDLAESDEALGWKLWFRHQK